jgi:hypothetical protein
MSDSPNPNDTDNDTADFATLAADPEIAPLLDFEPVPRRIEVEGGWSPSKQREFIARLAVHGSKNKACNEMGMHTTGMTKLQNSPGSKSFRAAWERAVDLARRRRREEAVAESVAFGATLPTIDLRRKSPSPQPSPFKGEGGGAPGTGGEGQILNEFGEWEDEESLHRRADEARDGMARKMLQARRLYLQEISHSPGKRAAFEILTELPIDWERAARLAPQPDEPWRYPNQRNADMILTAESGWSLGECGYGPDRMAELRRALNAHRQEQGLDPLDPDEDE